MTENSIAIMGLEIEPAEEKEIPNKNTLHYDNNDENDETTLKHLYVLPVILMEFLALALTRAVIPPMLLEYFQDSVYLIMGLVEFIRGMLAFIACPLFGKISDVVGRKLCLFITVLGTCSPVCILALIPADSSSRGIVLMKSGNEAEPSVVPEGEDWAMELDGIQTSNYNDRIIVFVVLLALSGMFSSTFTLTFAYISDVVKSRNQRVSAFGLALATFGLSFTVGPIAGGYIAKSTLNSNEHYGKQLVFTTALILTLLDLLYIYFILPESIPNGVKKPDSFKPTNWSPLDTFRIFNRNKLLQSVSTISFFYYTSLWAVVSTLVLYATKRFHMGTERLGELISAFGFSTMLAEAFIVRFVVPLIGEKSSMKLGLIAFTLQCIVLAFAFESWHLFLCVALSSIGNLVYPALSSLVSNSVPPNTLGEVLGAINGIKALTEGVGPLLFGTLMTFSEKNTVLPGWPYLVAAIFSAYAYYKTENLPDENDEDYSLDKEQILNESRGNNSISSIIKNRETASEVRSLLDSHGEDDEI